MSKQTTALVVIASLALLIFMIVREVQQRGALKKFRRKEERKGKEDEFEYYRSKLEWVLTNQQVPTNDPRMKLVYKNGTELNSSELGYWQMKIMAELKDLGALDTKSEAENAELDGVRQNMAHLAELKKPFQERKEKQKEKNKKVVKPITGF